MNMEGRAVWVYTEIVDFRKQINGLVEMVIHEFKRDPNDGVVYLFRNRSKDKVKALFWDRNGFVLMYKRLEKGRFDFPKTSQGSLEISREQYDMILSGMPVLYYGKGPIKLEYS